MATAVVSEGLFKTNRVDTWWIEPVLTVAALVLFGVYGFWAAAQGAHYEWGPYLSPFYSPNFHELIPGLDKILPFSPAFLILWAPLGFRATCYFYRRVYYRSFFLSPPACAVQAGDPKPKKYRGETIFPFLLQNMHRYFFYIAAVLAILHWWHAAWAFNFDGHFGVGVGTLVILLDAIFLSLYVFSCHSWRHLLAGKLNCFTCDHFSKKRHEAWTKQSILNENHMVFAWISLFTVGFADLYIRMVSMGVIPDIQLFLMQ